MKRSKPPAVATWLLEHLTSRRTNDALAGDLLEEFTHGRSASWYWRQVLLAIRTSFLKELRSASFGLGFALLWSVGCALFWGRFFFPRQIQFILQEAPAWYFLFPWPWSTVVEIGFLSALTTVPIAVGLSFYLLVLRRFTISRYFLGVSLAFVLQVARMLALPGVLKHSRSFSPAIFFAIMALTIWVAKRGNTGEARPGMAPISLPP
jgi:hypothetical protein